jgi:hypothetical protein
MTDLKVVPIDKTPGRLGRVRPEIIEILEDALAVAKNGELDGIAIIQLDRNGYYSHDRYGIATLGMLGAIERLKHNILLDFQEYDGDSA